MSSNSSPSPNPWSILRWLAITIFPPLATILPPVQQLTHNNRVLTIVLIAIYELGVLVVSLLTKVWKRLEEPWSKQIADVLDQRVHIILSRYDYHYRRKFCRAYQNLDVISGTQSGRPLELEHVFVDLRIVSKAPHRVSANPVRLPSELQTGRHSIWEYLQASDLMVLGAAGSGKTMLVKHLGLTLMQRKRPHQMKRLPYLLPLLFFLRDLSPVINEKPDYTLPAAVRAQTEKWQSPPMPPEWIEHHLARGHCLILLDGLDEVVDLTQRITCCRWVKQQMIAYAGNRFVITSRPYDDNLSNPLSGETTVLEVQPFTFEQITRFVNNWYLTNEIKSALLDDRDVRKQAEARAQDLLRQLLEREALIALAVNPLLLTMITLLHHDWYQDRKESLPVERATLYKKICEIFLGRWQEARGIRQELRAEQRKQVLQPLAYHMMLQGIQAIPCAETERIIRNPLLRVSLEISPKTFLKSIQNSSGLLLEGDLDTYSFAHLTFQEYLAAIHVREHKLEQILTTNVNSSWWYGTIRFYCALAGATSIVAACLAEQPRSAVALTLALECLQEAGDVQAEVKQQLNRVIDEESEDRDPERRHVIAEALLDRRLHQMRPLNERVSIDTSLVTHAEYQLFLDEEMRDDYRPIHWTDASFPSGAGRIPVLGVSQSSARAFCWWLTNRSTGVWQYRLPDLEVWEQGAKSIWRGQSKEAGFWAKQLYQFIWPEGEVPSSLQMQLKSALDHALGLINLVQDRDRTLALEGALARNLEHALAGTRNVDLTRLRGRASANYDHNMACACAFTLARDFIRNRGKFPGDHRDTLTTLTLDLDLTDQLCYDPQFALDHILHNTLKLKLGSTFHRTNVLDSELDYALDVLPDFIRYLFSADTKEKGRPLTVGRIAPDFACTLVAYIMFFLLQKRRIGVLPAYEGILLVREHKEVMS